MLAGNLYSNSYVFIQICQYISGPSHPYLFHFEFFLSWAEICISLVLGPENGWYFSAPSNGVSLSPEFPQRCLPDRSFSFPCSPPLPHFSLKKKIKRPREKGGPPDPRHTTTNPPPTYKYKYKYFVHEILGLLPTPWWVQWSGRRVAWRMYNRRSVARHSDPRWRYYHCQQHTGWQSLRPSAP